MMSSAAPPPAIYVGMRRIETGGMWDGEPAPALYDVTESYAAAKWKGRVATLHGMVAYRSLGPSADGIVLNAATIDQQEQINPDGSVRLLSSRRVTVADHLRGATSSVFRRSVEIAFAGGQTMIPASLVPHQVVLPLAATLSTTDSDRGGPLGGSYAESDLHRTTNADGSFEETGAVTFQPSTHRVRQNADGSATAYDSVPGFSMSDVSVAVPEGAGPDARVTVTVKSQGRTIGPTPIDTNEYVVPVWYVATWPAPLATAKLTVEKRRPPDARCALGSAPLVPVVIERKQVDVTGRIVEEREERDLDGSRRVLCHLTTTTTRRYDVKSGSVTGAVIDTTVVHLTGRPPRA